jgi:hypothetical protein
MIKFNISNIITRAETIGKNCSSNNKKKTAVKKIETTKKIFTSNQDDKQNKIIKKRPISKVDSIKTNLISQTKKTTIDKIELKNRISQVKQLNDFYTTNFDYLSIDMQDQLKKTQNLANQLENPIKSQQNNSVKKYDTIETTDTALETTKEQENTFNKAFNLLMKYNNTQMKILKPYMNKRYAILQDIDKTIAKQTKNKSPTANTGKLITERNLLRKQYSSYKKTVNMLKNSNSKTYKKSLDDDVKQLDAKIKKLNNISNKKVSSLYSTQTNKNKYVMSNIDDYTSKRNKLNDTMFKMTHIELKTSAEKDS